MKNWIKYTGLLTVSMLLFMGGRNRDCADNSNFSVQDSLFSDGNDYISSSSSIIPLFSIKEEINQITSLRVPISKTNKYKSIFYPLISTKELFGKFIIRRYISGTVNLFIKFRKCDITFPFHFFS